MAHLLLPGQERCCALLGHAGGAWHDFIVRGYFLVDNAAPDPVEHYAVKGSSLNSAHWYARRYSLGDVIGVIHSHLPHHDPWPSVADVAGLREGWLGGVVSPLTDGVHWFTAFTEV